MIHFKSFRLSSKLILPLKNANILKLLGRKTTFYLKSENREATNYLKGGIVTMTEIFKTNYLSCSHRDDCMHFLVLEFKTYVRTGTSRNF